MPIGTDSDEWVEAEDAMPMGTGIIAFLAGHPGQAFTIEELCDEVLDAGFHIRDKRERLREELSEDEFFDLRRSEELPGGEDYSGGALIHIRQTMRERLDRLAAEGAVVVKSVEAEALAVEDIDTEIVYSIPELDGE